MLEHTLPDRPISLVKILLPKLTKLPKIITKNNLTISLLTFWLILIYVFYLQNHDDVYDQDVKAKVQVS